MGLSFENPSPNLLSVGLFFGKFEKKSQFGTPLRRAWPLHLWRLVVAFCRAEDQFWSDFLTIFEKKTFLSDNQQNGRHGPNLISVQAVDGGRDPGTRAVSESDFCLFLLFLIIFCYFIIYTQVDKAGQAKGLGCWPNLRSTRPVDLTLHDTLI